GADSGSGWAEGVSASGPGASESTRCGTGPGAPAGTWACGVTLTGTSMGDDCCASMTGAVVSAGCVATELGCAATGLRNATAGCPSMRTPVLAVPTNVAQPPSGFSDPMRHAIRRLPASHPVAAIGW